MMANGHVDEQVDEHVDASVEAQGPLDAQGHWHCVICGIDLGPHNPRQYCCKTYCPMEGLEVEEVPSAEVPPGGEPEARDETHERNRHSQSSPSDGYDSSPDSTG